MEWNIPVNEISPVADASVVAAFSLRLRQARQRLPEHGPAGNNAGDPLRLPYVGNLLTDCR